MDSRQKIDDFENTQEATHELDSSLGTWTVVSDTKSRETLTSVPTKKTDDNDDKIETLNQLEIPEARCHENETIDDLSDGISIISESESAGESAGRFLPNLILTQPMSSLEFKYSTNELINKMQSSMDNLFEPVLLSNNLGRTRESFSQTSNRQLLVPQTENDQLESNVNDEKTTSIVRYIPILRSGLTGLFYISAILAIVAFIAKIKYPEWELLGITSQIEPLTGRVLNLELQNSLLRAEIDIITKQVNYLNSHDQRQQSKKGNNYKNEEKWQYKQKYEDGGKDATSTIENRNNPDRNNKESAEYQKKKFKKEFKNPTIKVWTGVGNNLDHVRIPYDNLKNPYICNKNEEDIAGFCVSTSKESITDDGASTVHKHKTDTINNVVVKEESSTKKEHVVVKEESSTKEEYVVEEVPSVKEASVSTSENIDANHLLEETEECCDRSKYQKTDNQNNNEQVKSTRTQNKKFDKSNYIKNNSESVENSKVEKHKNKKGKPYFDPLTNNSEWNAKYKEDKENNYKPRKFDGDKKKQHNSYEEEDSNKKFDKFKNKDDNRNENSDWHDRMMKHRESSRKFKVDEENWYMKRAKSRKEARIDDDNNKDHNKNNYNKQNNSGKHKNN